MDPGLNPIPAPGWPVTPELPLRGMGVREGTQGLGSDVALLPLCCVASGKSLPLSGPQFSAR